MNKMSVAFVALALAAPSMAQGADETW